MAIDVEETYKRHGPMVLRRCRSLLHDEQQAVDAMHDVFVQLLVHRERLVDKGACSLLWRIATNVCLNKIRSRKRRPEDPQSEMLAEIAAIDDAESRGVARVVLGKLFAREPVSTGTMAVMHLVDGMTLEEVAESVGMSVSGVRKRLRTLRAGVMAREGAA
ncbi:sigma-70 family RNA polymerase sigma factor [Nannocystis sp. ILAH1]|uniref:RNA polymerase sigma factor n=1 Tax=unclassified Nannocystis TaxID=2627009 RepID=UPI00226FE08B|nr:MULTISPECIES: sigma-70 family RNA polymerase sigma factor [unclassified Nannocystis]MCY0994100.1 sigma-70 family RNA polymerase sigma factor [Nannocystis sp. ILAH1]MCY1067064.1 sigma-70 family RNA polymerase sigma factor [Nannocystis sp. RBIL2]